MSSDYVRVFSGNSFELQRIRAELQYNGIRAITKDEGESGRLAGFGTSSPGTQDLFVLREQADKAAEIIKDQTQR